MMQMSDTLDRIKEYDRMSNHKFQETQKVKIKRRRKKCIWPDCSEKAVSLGMCSKCRSKHYKNIMLIVNTSLYNNDERIELYHDIIKIAEKYEMTIGEMLLWLVSEGLNAFDKKKRKRKRKR